MNDMKSISKAIDVFPSLSRSRMSDLVDRAIDAVIHHIGEPPKEDDYLGQCGEEPVEDEYITGVSYWSIMEPLDKLVPVIFFFVFLISWIHMFDMMGEIANAIYLPSSASGYGLVYDKGIFILAHQFGSFFLAEAGILFFYSRHRLSGKRITGSLFLAALLTIVVLVANIWAFVRSADFAPIGLFLGILVPMITLGMGERLAELNRIKIQRAEKQRKDWWEAQREWDACRMDARDSWRSELAKWHEFNQNPRSHPKFRSLLAQEIVAFYRRSKIGQSFDGWSGYIDKMLAAREIARMGDMEDIDDMVRFFTLSPPTEPPKESNNSQNQEDQSQNLLQEMIHQEN